MNYKCAQNQADIRVPNSAIPVIQLVSPNSSQRKPSLSPCSGVGGCGAVGA